jgi:hypothetical protein
MRTPNVDKVKHYSCDVLVIGSGVSGYCAAIEAGRQGCRTILVEKDEVLGGNAGPNLGVGITGADRYNHYGTETGVVHETQEEGAWIQAFTQMYSGAMGYNISRRYEAAIQQYLEQAGVTILKRHYAKQPILDDEGVIVGILAEDLAAFQSVEIAVRHVVIEASGDGEIGFLAGADFDMGSEAQNEFGERSAPETRTNTVQGTSLVAIARRLDREVRFVPPAATPPFTPRLWHGRLSSFLHHHDGWFRDDMDMKFLYVTEAGGSQDTIREDAAIYETLLKQLWAEWDHIKNGPHREAARNWDLVWVSPKAGKRESRRLLGDVILTQTDLESGRLYEDDIAYGGHDLDDHQPFREGSNIFGHSIPPMYGIPYRTCYSRNVPNLLLAGRLISATHLAHSSTRLMRTGGAIGQAVGLAAALCCKHGCRPADIYETHLAELQTRLLEGDGTILGRALECEHDLAPQSVIEATSELRFNDQEPLQLIPLIARTGVVLWDWDTKLEALELYLRNHSHKVQDVQVTILHAESERKWKTVEEYERFGRNDLSDAAFREIERVTAYLPAGYEGWFKVALPQPLTLAQKDCTTDDDRLIIALDANPQVDWALLGSDSLLADLVEHSHFLPEWREIGGTAALRLDPAPRLGEATNVANGFHRRFSRAPLNMWISDPEQGLPQELTLSWADEKAFDQIWLTFDNLPHSRHNAPWENGTQVLPYLVKAYELAYWDEATGTWQALVSEASNYNRFRRHPFPRIQTSKLRLRVLATHGTGESARVYQVRVLDSETHTCIK